MFMRGFRYFKREEGSTDIIVLEGVRGYYVLFLVILLYKCNKYDFFLDSERVRW